MTFYTKPELADLLAYGESHRVERKRLASNRSAIRRNICAFANDLPGAGRPAWSSSALKTTGVVPGSKWATSC